MPLSDYKTALVTGASSGIGAACVTALRERGVDVVATARRSERLSALAAETGCRTLQLDVRDTDALYRELGKLEADILINNAGLGRGFSGFLKSSKDDIEEMIDVNVTAAIQAVHAVAQGMAARKRGHIVNIGSIAGLYPIGFPVYGATKGAIHLFAQHLRIDLKGTGVRLTEICPGRVATEFFDTAIPDAEKRTTFMSGFSPLRPEDIAAAIVYALDAPWHVNVSTIELTPTEQAPGGAVIQPVER
jgi:3-hydroxy acid dehydrogenase/malonic semialdehyde reductase